MVFVQKSKFFLFVFFWTNQVRKCCFLKFLDEKEWFLDVKIEVLKSAKHRHFPKGIIHGFCSKIKLFFIYFLGESKSLKIFFLF